MSSKTELPSYDSQTEKTINEKGTFTECKHEGSATSHIDSYLRQPSTKAAIRTLINALEDLTDDNQCTQCTTQKATLAMTAFMRDMHSAKKSGDWSKQDQKAVKQEFKGMFKGMKGEMKDVWKGKQAGVAAA